MSSSGTMIQSMYGMMTTTMNKPDQPVGAFLCDYATTLLECGATTVRIEKNVGRIAEAYGCRAEVNIYPQHVEVVERTADTEELNIFSKTIGHGGINYATISALSKLSWNCIDDGLPLPEVRRQYTEICSVKRLPSALVTLLASLANASFCRLFEGDLPSMAIVFVATLCGFYLKGALCSKFHLDLRASIIIAGCVSAVLSCAGYVFGWGETPDVALATSVLYLVPGIPYLNAVSDLINGHYICATSRFIHAATLTVCLSVGLYLGLLLMHVTL